MTVIGIPEVDCFLTAGLACHRVHHILPLQKSGFSNIKTEPLVRELCKEFKIEWKPAKNYITNRFRKIFSFYILAPGRMPGYEAPGLAGVMKEAFSFEGAKRVVSFIFFGFSGVGSL
jgi:hypothetical protein